MDGTVGKEYLKKYVEDTRPILQGFLTQEVAKSAELGEVPQKLLQQYKEMISAGKGIRGSLIKLAYLASGGKDQKEITKVSTFVELFHSAILIHDDFMDRDPIRRGLPTAHTQFAQIGKDLGVKIPPDHYGNTMAVCLGDAGIYLSWKMLLGSSLPQEVVLETAKTYANFIVRLALGQSLDMTITGAEEVTEEDIMRVIWTKSGEYTAMLPLMCGATLAAQEDPHVMLALGDYAKCFGWAFQIQDDILGLYADEERLGKPVGSDIREGKNTLLMLHLRKNGTPDQINFMKSVLGNPDVSDEDIQKMKDMLKESGAYQHVIDLGWKYVEEGKQHIPKITENKELQDVFESLIVFMMERTK